MFLSLLSGLSFTLKFSWDAAIIVRENSGKGQSQFKSGSKLLIPSSTPKHPEIRVIDCSPTGCWSLHWVVYNYWPLLDLIQVFYKSASCRTCANKMHWLSVFLFPLTLYVIFLAHSSNLLSLKDKLWEISQGNWTAMAKNVVY